MRRATIIAAALALAGCAARRAPPPVPLSEGPPPAISPATPPAAGPSHVRPAPPRPSHPEPAPSAAGLPAAVQSPPAAAPGLRDLFPHVRADIAARVVEFDGIVPLDAHNQQTPDVYLEVIVCTPDTKEHESLVMTRALPSHIHAALLAIGLRPGHPGSWKVQDDRLVTVPPEGDAIEITFITTDASGHETESRPRDWIVTRAGRPILAEGSPTPFVFAGSRMATRQGLTRYDADGTGTLVGLTTFGMETVAWREVLSPESTVMEPDWLANAARVPKFGTPVTVRMRPVAGGTPSAPAAK
ncbi:MAG: hypothetical protein IT437_02080 [Phycisphaerales bacterium]|nr:hypothetical protein [Phycisphaerales bacterium]